MILFLVSPCLIILEIIVVQDVWRQLPFLEVLSVLRIFVFRNQESIKRFRQHIARKIFYDKCLKFLLNFNTVIKKRDFSGRYVFTLSVVALFGTFHDASYKIHDHSLQQQNYIKQKASPNVLGHNKAFLLIFPLLKWNKKGFAINNILSYPIGVPLSFRTWISKKQFFRKYLTVFWMYLYKH